MCNELTPLVSGATGTPWLAQWTDAESRAQAVLEAALNQSLSEPAVARVLSGIDAHLVVSSSMPVRPDIRSCT